MAAADNYTLYEKKVINTLMNAYKNTASGHLVTYPSSYMKRTYIMEIINHTDEVFKICPNDKYGRFNTLMIPNMLFAMFDKSEVRMRTLDQYKNIINTIMVELQSIYRTKLEDSKTSEGVCVINSKTKLLDTKYLLNLLSIGFNIMNRYPIINSKRIIELYDEIKDEVDEIEGVYIFKKSKLIKSYHGGKTKKRRKKRNKSVRKRKTSRHTRKRSRKN